MSSVESLAKVPANSCFGIGFRLKQTAKIMADIINTVVGIYRNTAVGLMFSYVFTVSKTLGFDFALTIPEFGHA